MWNETCEKIFVDCIKQFEIKKIKYFILRNYEGLPKENSAKDVDIVVDPTKLSIAVDTLKLIYKKYGLQFYDESRFDRLICMHGISIEKSISIHIDIIGGYRVKGFEPIKFDKLYKETIKHNGFNILNEHANGFMLLIYKCFGYKTPKLKEEYKEIIYDTYIDNPDDFQEKLEEIMTHKIAKYVCETIKEKDFVKLLGASNKLTRSIMIKTIQKSPIKTVKGMAKFLIQKFDYIVLSYKKHIRGFAVIAPDGTGKTTFIEKVTDKLNEYYVGEKDKSKFHIYHFRPGIIPNLGAVGEKTGLMKEDKDWERPHRRKPANALSSLVRITYYTFDYLVGWQKYIRKDVHYDKYSIFDRYSYDLLVDSERSRIKLPFVIKNMFVRITPKLPIVFLLKADSEKIFSRKQELTLEEIEQQQQGYKMVSTKYKEIKIIDANDNIENMVSKAVNLIAETYWQKL